MSKTLLIHIGHYKTGTTALQSFFARSSCGWERWGSPIPRAFRYAQAFGYNYKHSAYAFSILKAVGVRRLLHGYYRSETPEELWGELFAEIDRSRSKVTLISSEELVRLAQYPAAMARLADILASRPDIKPRVILYLRPVRSHLASWYNQLVKMNCVSGGRDRAWLREIEAIHYDYRAVLEPWLELLPREDLIIRPYLSELRHGTRLFTDFLQSAGLPMPIVPIYPDSDPNPRLDERLLDLRRSLAKLGMREARIAGVEEEIAAFFQDREAELDPQHLAELAARVEGGVEALSEVVGPDFPIERFRAGLPEPQSREERERAWLVEYLAKQWVRERRQSAKRVRDLEEEVARLRAAAGGSDKGAV